MACYAYCVLTRWFSSVYSGAGSRTSSDLMSKQIAGNACTRCHPGFCGLGSAVGYLDGREPRPTNLNLPTPRQYPHTLPYSRAAPYLDFVHTSARGVGLTRLKHLWAGRRRPHINHAIGDSARSNRDSDLLRHDLGMPRPELDIDFNPAQARLMTRMGSG